MKYKILSWILAIVAVLTHVFGLFNIILFVLLILLFLFGMLIILYTNGGDPELWQKEMLKFLKYSEKSSNPLESTPEGQRLGLNLAGDQKQILLIAPKIKIQTESKKSSKSSAHKQQQFIHHPLLFGSSHHPLEMTTTTASPSPSSGHKKSFIDSGIEMLFKKTGKSSAIKEGHHLNLESQHPSSKSSGAHACGGDTDRKWKPFETIKIYGDKKFGGSQEKINKENIQFGEDIASASSTHSSSSNLSGIQPYNYTITIESDAHLLDEHGSPKKKFKAMLTGNKKIDQLLHTIIDYIIRDFIDSWFCSLSDNKEFGDFRVRNCIEESVTNICNRIKNVEWIPLMTTKLIDDIAVHTKFYRLANQAIRSEDKTSDSSLPQRKNQSSASQKSVANSKFYLEVPDEKVLLDPEANLLNAFFNQCDQFRKECSDEIALEKYLTRITETILYFTLPEEDFACIPLRTFLSTLLANVVLKPFLKMVSDPDFINLEVAKLIAKDTLPVEYFIKALQQSNDLSELRACRQLITKEMNEKSKEPLKAKDSSIMSEINSLREAQNIIDKRITQLQKKDTLAHDEVDSDIGAKKLPILTLDELLFKELARSYFLDYLSTLNLQKYVIFYLRADEWKCIAKHSIVELQSNRSKSSKEEIYCNLKERAQNIYIEYLQASSNNFIQIDQGLIEALSIKLKDPTIVPEPVWFDSICKFVYEKLKNEEIFLSKFYQSTSYKKLLRELEVCVDDVSTHSSHDILGGYLDNYSEFPEHCLGNLGGGSGGSDSNSGDINFDDDMLDLVVHTTSGSGGTGPQMQIQNIDPLRADQTDQSVLPFKSNKYPSVQIPPAMPKPSKLDGAKVMTPDLLDITYKHSRSHSDCTGINPSMFSDLSDSGSSNQSLSPYHGQHLQLSEEQQQRAKSAPTQRNHEQYLASRPKIAAKIINTAILNEGQYAVYAVHVTVVEDKEEKSWHIYRRYSKFLELKKMLVKKYPQVARLPFPAKKAFQNTQRVVLEHRMVLLNEFLRFLCEWSENNAGLMKNLRDFLEPDTDDRKIHGGAMERTIETLVNPLKSGMRTIRSMPDTLVGGFSRMLLGKGPLKEQTLLEINIEQSEYPALNSAIHLLDEVFDLQARSQWLRRGIINRVLGAPWVSQTANKKIVHHAKSLIELEKIEQLLGSVIKSIWPDGKSFRKNSPRDDTTKLRTRVAAQMSLFTLLFDDLKRVVGSETTRHGLLNLFEMWQHGKLNLRLALILLNDVLTCVYKVESMTAHVQKDEY
ncbi:sorting nexin-13-like isoform X2 [Condylostylus longicornis]|uniref:sorting nexin-13-like isoform X2 n=1 Tax=Condylostylus longicornis TaxID=2530218 RepID=UPI00244DBC3C|nr:sorting nexin-13-like isoform X2 [Condylostylus longicornis]